MDIFSEELVVRKNSPKHIAKLAIYLILIFAVPAIFILLGLLVNAYFIIVAICAFFFVVYGSYYLVTGLYVEYEYTITNSNITVDKISAKRSRKRILSVDIKRFNTLKKLKDCDLSKKSYKKIFNASVTDGGDDVYAAEMHLDKFHGDCLLLFSPTQKTLDAMKPHLKNTIRVELFKGNASNSSKKAQTAFSEKKAADSKNTAQPANKAPETYAAQAQADSSTQDKSNSTSLAKEKAVQSKGDTASQAKNKASAQKKKGGKNKKA